MRLQMMSSERSFSVGIPVSVFFLTLDRCLTLGLNLGYRHWHQRIVLICFVLVISAVIMFTDFAFIGTKFITGYELKKNSSGM